MPNPVHRKYSVRLLRFPVSSPVRPDNTATRETASTKASLARPGQSVPEPNSANPAQDAPIRSPYRRFEVPLTARIAAVKQTLVQLDLPPDLVLRHEVPLPTVLVWTPPSRPITEFVVPPVSRTLDNGQTLIAPPVLESPNQETHLADLKIAASFLNETSRLVRPPATTSPVSRTGAEPAVEVPQFILSEGGEPSAAPLISLSDLAIGSSVVALPPANQVAPFSGSTVTSGKGASHDELKGGVEVRQVSTSGLDVGVAAGKEPLASDVGAGISRITRPRDGKFGVVVMGSTPSGPYNSEPNPLSGKLVYTVYVDVGLRKKWILQYCDEVGTKGAGELAPPWPFHILRPDTLNSLDAEYLMVHGTIDALGRFSNLALIFPAELQEKESLLKALKDWEFRPASRNGEGTAVEALLIIPKQPE